MTDEKVHEARLDEQLERFAADVKAELLRSGSLAEQFEAADRVLARWREKNAAPPEDEKIRYLARIHHLEAEVERLRADRDCEKRMRKDSDDRATTLEEAVRDLAKQLADAVPPEDGTTS